MNVSSRFKPVHVFGQLRLKIRPDTQGKGLANIEINFVPGFLAGRFIRRQFAKFGGVLLIVIQDLLRCHIRRGAGLLHQGSLQHERLCIAHFKCYLRRAAVQVADEIRAVLFPGGFKIQQLLLLRIVQSDALGFGSLKNQFAIDGSSSSIASS